MRLLFISFVAEGQSIESVLLRIHAMIGTGYGNIKFRQIIALL